MIQYEDDASAITRAINALGKGEIIDHGTARTIASGYNDHRTAHFVTTGYMPRGDAQWLMDAIERGVDTSVFRRELVALRAYLTDREGSGETGRVDGWSDMWVPKHVDYPHEGGQLDTCWCYGEDDDTDA